MRLYQPTRRDLIRLAALSPALALPRFARAELSGPVGGQAPGYFKFSLGDLRITIASDGNLVNPASAMAANAPEGELAAFLQVHRLSADSNYAHTNHVIIQSADQTLLVDAGSGTRFQASAGRLMQNLDAAGIAPEDIDLVALTHCHPDHVWGLRDDFDELFLPDAQYFLGQAEYDHWTAPDLVETITPGFETFVVGAVNSLEVVEPSLSLVADGHTVMEGVTMIDTPGHTVGHMGLYVENNGHKLLVLGDAIAHAFVSFERPDWVQQIDEDPEATIATRRRLLDWAAAEGIALAGYHFPFPGVGHVMKDGDAYRFVPALWDWG
jgi:glyoxylase-like metal-dependent hydrolase (beta-lactamase superfamily II)